MDLVLFDQAIEHVARIARIIRQVLSPSRLYRCSLVLFVLSGRFEFICLLHLRRSCFDIVCAYVCVSVSQPFGHALLVGVGGSGRSSSTVLAAFVEDYALHRIEVHTLLFAFHCIMCAFISSCLFCLSCVPSACLLCWWATGGRATDTMSTKTSNKSCGWRVLANAPSFCCPTQIVQGSVP